MDEFEPQAHDKKAQATGIRPWVFALSLFAMAVISAFATLFITGNLAASNRDTGTSISDVLKIPTTTPNQVPKGELAEIEKVYYYLTNNYVNKDITTQEIVNGALKGMADAVGDPYTTYMVNEETMQIDQTLTGSFGGIGAELKSENGQVMISTTMEGTPSRKVGLQTNDVILKVDGNDMTGKTISEVVSVVRGPAGTDVVLTILRNMQEMEVTITRAEIAIVTVVGTVDETDNTIGHVKITSFSRNTADELQTAVESLRQQGVKSLIFDLRHNPGGLLDQAIAISNMFLKDGDTILQIEDRDGNIRSYKASDKDYGDFKITEPYILLVDEGSASASEILAGALQESVNAKILGVTTYGKGTVQTVIPISDTSELKFTNAKWLTPDGNWINEKGITPSIEVKLPDYAFVTIIDTRETVELGNVSDNVKNIETMLKALGYDVTVDGYFDEGTKKAVEAYQASKNLPVNGQIDLATANALMDEIRQLIVKNDTQYKAAVEELKK